MCLSKILEEVPPTQEVVRGFAVKRRLPGGYDGPWNGSEKLVMGEWSPRVSVDVTRGTLSYVAGFHFFLHLEDALKYLNYLENSLFLSSLVVVEVEARGVYLKGEQGWLLPSESSEVWVAEEERFIVEVPPEEAEPTKAAEVPSSSPEVM